MDNACKQTSCLQKSLNGLQNVALVCLAEMYDTLVERSDLAEM